jgi:hypothetical protein
MQSKPNQATLPASVDQQSKPNQATLPASMETRCEHISNPPGRNEPDAPHAQTTNHMGYVFLCPKSKYIISVI